MKKKLKLYMLILLAAALTGCGNTGKKQMESNTGPETETEKELWQEDSKGCLILEDEDSVYVCGTYKLLKVNKESKKQQVLWENDGSMLRQAAYMYSEGRGILINEKIYFIEAWMEEDGETESKALAVVDTDGEGYHRIKQLSGNSYKSDLLVLDGMLYVGGDEDTFCYEVYADGTLSKQKPIEDVEAYQHVPEGYSQISYYDNGRRTFFAALELKDLGYLLLRDADYNLVKIVPETGEKTVLPDKFGSLEAYNDQYLLTSEYNDGREWCLTDKETLEKTFLIKFDAGEGVANIIAMDEKYVYMEMVRSIDDEEQYFYEKISLPNGERSVIFTDCAQDKGFAYYSPESLSDMVLKNGYLYYTGTKDYKLYLMRRSLNAPSEEEILGDAFYDTGISQVGEIESYRLTLFSDFKPDLILAQADLEWLHIDEQRFKGAEEINRCLNEYQDNNIAYTESNAEWLEEDVKEYGDSGITCSYSSTVSEIAYFDGKYLSFCQQDYDYSGGAHGMSLWTGFTFDLETGQRLGLEDMIGNSEEELKEIVTEYFAEYIGRNPENFWEDAVSSVKEWTSFDSQFYLTKEGIRFYFEPYALACYAAGFSEVTIPYEEFEMKISLNEAKN